MHPNTYLAQNKRGVWEIRWTDRDERGQSRSQRASTGQTDEAAADAYRAQWLRARAEAIETLSTPTVGEIIDAYLEDCRGRGVRSSQWRVVMAVRQSLGMHRPRDLREPLREFKRTRGLAVAPATLGRELGALIAALNWAAHPDKGALIDRGDVPVILKPVASHKERQFLDEQQEAAFHAAALAWRWKRVRLYVALGLNTGARKEAIEQLTWERVDLDAGVIDFRVPDARVTRKRRVATPINNRLRAVLEQVPSGERHGGVVSAGNIKQSFNTFRASTPWPWVSSHIMRHTFITLSLRAGVSIWEVAQLVGDTPEIISKHYGHHAADWRLKDAANKRFEKAA